MLLCLTKIPTGLGRDSLSTVILRHSSATMTDAFNSHIKLLSSLIAEDPQLLFPFQGLPLLLLRLSESA